MVKGGNQQFFKFAWNYLKYKNEKKSLCKHDINRVLRCRKKRDIGQKDICNIQKVKSIVALIRVNTFTQNNSNLNLKLVKLLLKIFLFFASQNRKIVHKQFPLDKGSVPKCHWGQFLMTYLLHKHWLNKLNCLRATLTFAPDFSGNVLLFSVFFFFCLFVCLEVPVLNHLWLDFIFFTSDCALCADVLT